MAAERKTLGIRNAAAPKADARAGFALKGARLENLKERARAQRRNPTEAQKALWSRLAESKLGGAKFTRQAVVGSAIVDFACPSRWITVQLSPEGANAEVDALQDRKLADVGIRVLRFAESRVLEDMDGVCDAILAELQKPFDRKAASRQAAISHPLMPTPEVEGA